MEVIKKVTKAKPWTTEEIELLKDLYPDHYNVQICEILNRNYSSIVYKASCLGLKKSDSFKKIELQKQAEKLKIVGQKSRFQKGMIPVNKGVNISQETYEKIKPFMFKKGNKPPNTLPDWHESVITHKNKLQYVMIKIPGHEKMRPKHVWLWEQKYGKVQKGYNIVFKDGNQLNCTIDNLECISDGEIMKRNTIHNYPQELKSTILLLKKLKNKIDATK
jgi:hypothetical protein